MKQPYTLLKKYLTGELEINVPDLTDTILSSTSRDEVCFAKVLLRVAASEDRAGAWYRMKAHNPCNIRSQSRRPAVF